MIRIKICGITNLADAKAATDAGANALGFNFYEKSLRRIVTADAAQIRSKLPPEIEAVGVFVNAKPADINSLRAFVRFDAAQLHGDEDPDIVSRVASSLPVIKAFRVDANFPLAALDRFPGVFAFLLDAARAGQYGGTGQITDWDFARRAASCGGQSQNSTTSPPCTSTTSMWSTRLGSARAAGIQPPRRTIRR